MHLGINAYAFPKQQALNIISKLKEKNVPILGKDVYCLKNSLIIDSCDSWYCNFESGETQQDSMKRSYLLAKNTLKIIQRMIFLKKIFSIVTETDALEYIE